MTSLYELYSLHILGRKTTFARHLIMTYKQKARESIDEFLRKLRSLLANRNYQDVTTEQHVEALCGASIQGIKSSRHYWSIEQLISSHKST